MKELSDLLLPATIRYTKSHEWVRAENGEAVIGITDYAQDQLGDIVYVELPPVGSTFNRGEEFGTVESVKAVSDLLMPATATVTATNPALENDPGLVNAAPYEAGWLLRVQLSDPAELDALLTSEAYLARLRG